MMKCLWFYWPHSFYNTNRAYSDTAFLRLHSHTETSLSYCGVSSRCHWLVVSLVTSQPDWSHTLIQCLDHYWQLDNEAGHVQYFCPNPTRAWETSGWTRTVLDSVDLCSVFLVFLTSHGRRSRCLSDSAVCWSDKAIFRSAVNVYWAWSLKIKS